MFYRSKKNINWFQQGYQNGIPYSPSDFDLFQIPNYNFKTWMKKIAGNPKKMQASNINISNIGNIGKLFYSDLNEQFNIDSSSFNSIVNRYLGVACPNCFGGLTGELLLTIETYKSARGTLISDPAVNRIMSGVCATCDSKRYYLIWHGDKSYSN